MKHLYLVLLLTAFYFSVSAQTTITLQPDATAGQDARIWSLDPTTAAGSTDDFIAAYWTWSATPGILRSLIRFDLSSIPTTATITSAKLSLYYNPTSASAGQAGSNASFLQRVTSTWDENTVTWNTQPTVTTSGEAALAQSTTSNQNYPDINVKSMVKYMVGHPSKNYGFMLRLQDETTLYSSMKFASSDYTDASLHPKLVITYDTIPVVTDTSTCITWQPNAAEGNDSRVWDLDATTPTPTTDDFIAAYWTWNGTPGILRSLIKFDLSSIPATATLSSAKLSLRYNPTSASAGQAGSNASWLQRVTSAWDEGTVTWNTQPTTTTTNEKALAQSTNSTQNYLGINVKALVKYMVKHPDKNYGFMLRLQDETALYSSMKFASSDYSDASLRPKLIVCYTTGAGKQEQHEVEIDAISLRAYPNPFTDQLTLDVHSSPGVKGTIMITNAEGYQVTSPIIFSKDDDLSEINLNEVIRGLPSGIYFVQMISADQTLSTKIVKQE